MSESVFDEPIILLNPAPLFVDETSAHEEIDCDNAEEHVSDQEADDCADNKKRAIEQKHSKRFIQNAAGTLHIHRQSSNILDSQSLRVMEVQFELTQGVNVFHANYFVRQFLHNSCDGLLDD